jgi:hypothetical protein
MNGSLYRALLRETLSNAKQSTPKQEPWPQKRALLCKMALKPKIIPATFIKFDQIIFNLIKFKPNIMLK